MCKTVYMKRTERKNSLFKHCLSSAKEKGLFNFTIYDVADIANCSSSTVTQYHGGIKKIRKSIIEYGMDNNIDWILDTNVSAILK